MHGNRNGGLFIKIGHSVSLVPRRIDHALTLSSVRENKDYLHGITFDPDLQVGLFFETSHYGIGLCFLPAHRMH